MGKISARSCSFAWATWMLSHPPPWIGNPVIPSRKHLAAVDFPLMFLQIPNTESQRNQEQLVEAYASLSFLHRALCARQKKKNASLSSYVVVCKNCIQSCGFLSQRYQTDILKYISCLFLADLLSIESRNLIPGKFVVWVLAYFWYFFLFIPLEKLFSLFSEW